MHRLIFGVSLLAITTSAQAGEVKFKPLLDTRLRYETVDQQGIAKDADSVTMRVRSGAELSKGPFAFLAEAEATLAIDQHYNSGVNGKATFPIVADPQNIELNRIQLQYKTKPLTVTVGRQRINLDDQRFVGAVGWRQNEQTFDAVRVEWSGIKNLKADVTYSWSVRSIWGIDGGKFGATNRPQAMSGDNIFATLAYTTKIGTLTGFAYLVDEDETVVALRRNSSQTYGARFAGAHAFSKTVKLSYAASYARQSDYHTNPVDYSADYYAAELGLEAKGFKLTGGYELLGADSSAPGIAGSVFAFQTPYATLHKFNGWADKFLTTPAAGLEDKYIGIGYTVPKVGKMGPLAAVVTYHQFGSDVGNRHFGYEWDAQLSLKTSKRTTILAKFADYQRYGISDFAGDADTKKFILQLDYIL
ncbi:alginate export family protein [Sphingobium subterraneum]|uniref:Alginate export domain-containing protein n=1 Tax=Sphingobium subterraneum TaxID=627688 RepID=A0A841J4Y5_9SPHN|nr:alginate export family protein [Sphingobium subterraneum]MBB6124586.1 hypothetical protein [Sphingobium subterraneum]